MKRKSAGTRSESRKRRKVGPNGHERVAVWISKALAQRLRRHAVDERMSISLAVEEALTAYLARKG